MGFIWSIIIGIVAGYLAGKIMRGGAVYKFLFCCLYFSIFCVVL